jgi:DICT domain-containing protein
MTWDQLNQALDENKRLRTLWETEKDFSKAHDMMLFDEFLAYTNEKVSRINKLEQN